MSVQDKRERVMALRQQIEEEKIAHSTATSEANEVAQETRLDREIERLEAELAMFQGLPEPTGEVSEPAVVQPVDIRLSGEVRKDELVEMAESMSPPIEGASKMLKDDLIDAIRERTGVEGDEG
jgi:hypothetical protein